MPKKKVYGINDQREKFLAGCEAIEKARRKYCKSFNVLGIDPARGATGICNREDDIDFFGDTITSKYKGFPKVIEIEKGLKPYVISDERYFVGIEGYAYNSRWGREAAGELGGVIRRLLYYYKRPLLVISPLTIKAWIGASKKSNIMMEVLDKYGIKTKNDNEADAVVIAEIVNKVLHMAHFVVYKGIKDPEEVRVLFKEEEYKNNSWLMKLYKYQAKSIFSIIYKEGEEVTFFRKIKS